MDFVSPLLTIIKDYLATPIDRHISYALHVKTKLENLRNEHSSLLNIAADVGMKVHTARARLQTPLNTVVSWQEKVESLRKETEELLAIELSSHMLCKCLPNVSLRYKDGKRITQHLITVKDYKEQGKGFLTGAVVDPGLPSPAEENAAAIEEELKSLSNFETDVISMVEKAKIVQGLLPYGHVEDWCSTVAKHKDDAKLICDKFREMINKEEADLERKIWVKFSVDLESKLERTRALINEGKRLLNNKDVADPSRPVPVVQQAMMPVIGQEKAYTKVIELIEDDDVRAIGIYGMGGVGKTTLFKRINNSLKGPGYEIVIFVVVSKNASIEGVQRDIMKRLGINAERTSHVERESMIRNSLTNKKFVLMLDDIWTKLDLEEVGIPIYDNVTNYKILFTTRYESVCDQMNATKVKIDCLNEKEAWNLFEATVGKILLNSNPTIMKLGELVAKECGGLPLALTVIGGTMRGKTTILEWRDALSTLRQVEPELTGTLDKLLYKRLRFSYENLANDIMKECFCYCALLPEDWLINTDSLVDCWIGEGFFEGETIENSRSKGYVIIKELMRSCLLEEVEDDSNPEHQSVRLHDVVRDMVLWIKKDEFIVYTPGTKSLKRDKWDKVKRLSLTTDEGLETFFESNPQFPNLSTLLMEISCEGRYFSCDGRLKNLKNDFFLSMPGLRVLHKYAYANRFVLLSHLSFSTLRLAHLRYFSTLKEQIFPIKELGTMLSLEILKVNITFAPRTEKRLFPWEGVFSKLANLRILHIHFLNSSMKFEDLGVKVAELKALKHLEDLILPVSTTSYLKDLSSDPKLAHCISSITLLNLDMASCRLYTEFGSMDRLESISFAFCKSLQEIVIGEATTGWSLQNLKAINLMACERLQTLCFHKTMPQLEHITVEACSSLRILFTPRGESDKYVFPELRRIYLDGVGVEHICNIAFSFPRLEALVIQQCPVLKNLSKGIIKARKEHLKKIKCDKDCWDRLNWESEEDKIALLPLLQIM